MNRHSSISFKTVRVGDAGVVAAVAGVGMGGGDI